METKYLCQCGFQLVLAYNPEPGQLYGRRIEPEILAEILTGINRRFGDYSVFGPPADSVPSGTYKGQTEPSVRIEVAVPQERIQELRQYVIEIGEKLGQKAMYFIAGPPSVEIIQIEKKPKVSERGA